MVSLPLREMVAAMVAWPEHERFFEAAAAFLDRAAGIEVRRVKLDRDRIGALWLSEPSALLPEAAVVVPKYVDGHGVAPLTTWRSWMESLPKAAAMDFPSAKIVLMTNSPFPRGAGAPPPDVIVWGRTTLTQLVAENASAAPLLEFLPPSAAAAAPSAASVEAGPPEAAEESEPRPARSRRQRASDPPAPSPFALCRPAYSCDRVDGQPLEDRLGFARRAEVLASLLADEKVAMPLAVGLFGPWGSGKSFFMHLLQDAMGKMAGSAPHFVGSVLPIRFNAWHYMDSDLWSSVALAIFDGIAGQLAGTDADPAAERRKLLEEVESSKRLKAEAEQELAHVTQDRQEARETQTERIRATLKRVFSPERRQRLGRVLAPLGLDKGLDSLERIQAALAESRSLRAQASALLPPALARVPLPLLALGLMAIYGGVTFAAGFLIEQWHHGPEAALAPHLAALAGLGIWAMDRLRRFTGAVRDTRLWLAEAQSLLARQQDDGEGVTLRERIAALDRRIAKAVAQLQRVEQGEAIYDFVHARRTAKDYGEREGIVAILRRDLEGLEREWRRRDSALGRIGRIVLYIDDLDRCGPDRVVDVLQAVHLLLSFQLFAVVVAVDPRWLERALYKRYLPGHEDMSELERLSSEFSPHNYLEKIFQIPLRVGAMDQDGFAGLIESMLPAPEGQSGKATANQVATSAIAMRLQGETASEAEAPSAAALPPLTLTVGEIDWLKRLHPLVKVPRTARRLFNTYALIRLEKAQGGSLEEFLEAGDFRPLLLLLALDFGYPLQSRFLRQRLSGKAGLLTQVAICRSRCAEAAAAALAGDFAELEQALAALPVAELDPRLPALLPLVSRVSFHEPAVLEAVLALEKAPPPTDTS